MRQLRLLEKTYRRPSALFYYLTPLKNRQIYRFRLLPDAQEDDSPELRFEIRRAYEKGQSLALNPKDSTAFSYAAPSFYLKKEWEQRIVSTVKYGKASDLFEALMGLQNLPDFQRKNISNKIALMKKIKHQGPQAAVRLLRTQGGYDSFILKGSNIYDNQDNVILEDLEELQSSAKKFSTIDSFLQHIEKIRQIQQEQRKSADNPKVDAVRLLSIHKSKGMEFGYVFIIGALEGVLPHANCSGPDDVGRRTPLNVCGIFPCQAYFRDNCTKNTVG